LLKAFFFLIRAEVFNRAVGVVFLKVLLDVVVVFDRVVQLLMVEN